MNHRFAVIMAGGSGTRLWPLSRADKPKQFQQLIDNETLVQGMWRHLRTVLPAERIFVMAGPRFRSLVTEQLMELPESNLLYEPSAKDTGPAIMLATAELIARDAGAVVGIFWSDHVIRQPEEFTKVIEAAYAAAEEHTESVVGVGVKPTFADTGLGYIKMGKEVATSSEMPLFNVAATLEKPDQQTAERFVRAWEYLWNTGYKIFAARPLVQAFQDVNPDLAEPMRQLAAGAAAESTQQIDQAWEQFPKKAIEPLLMDQMQNLLVVPADLGWSDVGNWKTLHDVLSSEAATVVSRGKHVSLDDKNVLVYADQKLIVTIGLSDVIVVETEKAILVASKSKAQEVKKIVEQLRDQGQTDYL